MEIRAMYQPIPIFAYDESKVRFRVVYDAKYNELRITSGRHGYAMLAEACTMHAVTTDPLEPTYWDVEKPCAFDHLLTVMDPRL